MVAQQEKCLKIILFCIFGLHTYMYNIEFDDDDSDDGLLICISYLNVTDLIWMNSIVRQWQTHYWRN